MAALGTAKVFDVALLSPRADGEEERVQLGISREGVTLLQIDGTVREKGPRSNRWSSCLYGYRFYSDNLQRRELILRFYPLNNLQVVDSFPFSKIAKWLIADKRAQSPGADSPASWRSRATCKPKYAPGREKRTALGTGEVLAILAFCLLGFALTYLNTRVVLLQGARTALTSRFKPLKVSKPSA
jgi:hypothetical protein